MWYVYFLQNKKRNFIYVGITQNIRKRLNEHKRGAVQSTKAYMPILLISFIVVGSSTKARALEKYFKVGSGKAFLKKRILSDEVLA